MKTLLWMLEPGVVMLMLAGFPAAAFSGEHIALYQYVSRSEAAGVVDKHGALHFRGNRIVIPVVAVEPGKPDTTFEVHDEVNPTLVVPAGAELQFTLGNADEGMQHGLDVTARAPTYGQEPHLPMMAMAGRPGMTSGSGTMEKTVAATGLVSPATGNKSRLALRGTGWFSLKPGTYYYVCPVPGHARRGMYGKIVAH